MRCLLAATLLLAAASPSRAAWARFKVADFATTARHPAIVELDGGPALVVLESDNLNVLRRSGSRWERSTLPLDPKMGIYNFTACDCRGDGVKRLYLSFRSTPRIWEITPNGPRWTVDEFSPIGERPTEHHNSGPLVAGSSADGSMSLFVTHPDRGQIRECRWKKRWNCATIIRDDRIDGPMLFLHSDPPAWETQDLLFFQSALAARGRSGWKIVPGVDANSFPHILLSRTKPRTFYSFGQQNVEISLDRDLGVVERREMTKVMSGETVAVLNSGVAERIYGTAGEHVHEYREEDGVWISSVAVSFPGTQAYRVVAGDARGDGQDRLYVLETTRPHITPSRLWELVHYPVEDAVEVPDSESRGLSAGSRKALGDLLRAELGRHGGLSVLGPGGPPPAYRLLSSVETGGEFSAFKLNVVRADGSVLKELSGSAMRADLPSAMGESALQVAEDWPNWTAAP
ncbi:MAG: hypothetical protein HYX59_07345 [Elusimicrobia bacterium]|nr:hypothetical protein [Elusimicrobiota bacterium]